MEVCERCNSSAGAKAQLSFRTFDATNFILKSNEMFSFEIVPEIPSDAGIVGTVIIHLSLVSEAPFLEGKLI